MAQILTLLLILLSFVKLDQNAERQFSDLILDGNNIWALTTTGELALFDANTGKPLPAPMKTPSIVALAKDRNGDIVVGDKSNAIRSYNKANNAWKDVLNFEGTLFGISFDSANNYYLITENGVYDAAAKKYSLPDSIEFMSVMYHGHWYRKPVYMTDKNDNIWIGFGYGEWGGDLFIFDTKKKAFISEKGNNLQMYKPVKSIFESNDHVYVTCGLMHFTTSGRVIKFKDFTQETIFNSQSDAEQEGEYIGPGAYNPKDGYIYFYSQNGIFKGNPATDLSKLTNWTQVIKPNLRWKRGQPDAIGSPMNVLKLMFTNSGKLIFLSQNDGIGMYDGQKLVMIK